MRVCVFGCLAKREEGASHQEVRALSVTPKIQKRFFKKLDANRTTRSEAGNSVCVHVNERTHLLQSVMLPFLLESALLFVVPYQTTIRRPPYRQTSRHLFDQQPIRRLYRVAIQLSRCLCERQGGDIAFAKWCGIRCLCHEGCQSG